MNGDRKGILDMNANSNTSFSYGCLKPFGDCSEMEPGDFILLEDLEIRAFHGVLPEEKRLGQKFLLTIRMEMALRPAGISDDLNQSVSYADVARSVTKVFTETSHDLIETAAEVVARHILQTWPVFQKVTVCVRKPWAPIGLPLSAPSVTIRRGWHRAFVALGANLGARAQTLIAALASLETEQTHVVAASGFLETKPVGPVEQPDYLNAAAELRTLLTPWELLSVLQAIELEHGRTREIHWGPRTLDLDLLMYDQLITEDPELVLPHPRMMERRFVLQPLCEISPWLVHPLTRQRMADVLRELPE